MKSMIFTCVALVFMAGIARVYMAGGLGGLLNMGSGSDELHEKAPKNVKAVTTDADIQVYKWCDEHGVMHFGESPPDSDIAVEKIELKTNQNVINAVAVKKEEESSENKQVEMGNPYSPEGIAQMIGQAKALKDSLNQQTAEKERMMEGIR